MCQRIYFIRKKAISDVGYVFTYFCGGHKNNCLLQLCVSFRKSTTISPEDPQTFVNEKIWGTVKEEPTSSSLL